MRLITLGSLALEGATSGRQKPLLLLAYLALEGPKPRRQLVELFWPDAADGRDSLQTTVRRLRQVSADLVVADGDRLGTDVACDAHGFEAAVRSRDHDTALALYAGAFLEDLDLPLGEEVEEWLYSTRERLAYQARSVHLDLAERAVMGGRWGEGREHAERALTLPHGPARSGEELERLARLLEATDSPRALEVRRELAELGLTAPPLPGGTGRRTNLPRYATSFHGRRAELALIAASLATPHVRLLTVHGPGGVGKTRLAVESGRQHFDENRFPHGVYFVALEEVTAGEAAALAVAGAMSLGPSAAASPEDHVVGAIGERELLLVLDNFEHLVDVTDLPARIVRSCPNARVLVTSRRILNRAEEHVLSLGGLATTSLAGEPEALGLLHGRLAQHAAGAGTLSADDGHALRICELLDGNPLGIELAAASARYLPLAALAGELASGLDLLVNRDPTSAARHQSMHASLRLSWDLLSADQREALAALAAFRGGCDREAAREVAGLDLAMLGSLCDCALVRMLPSGRFEQHPLVQQFAAARLAEDEAEEQRLRAGHARYYLGRVAALGHDVLGGDTAGEALTWMETELANIGRAWRWAVEEGASELIADAAWALAHLGEMRSRYREAILLLESAVERLEGSHAEREPLGRLLGYLSFLYFRVGAVERSLPAGERAVGILAPLRSRSGNWGLWSAYQGMAMSNLSLSDQAEAKRHLAAGIATAEADKAGADGDAVLARAADVAIGISVQTLAYLAIGAGEHGEGIALLEEARRSFEPHRAPHLSYVYWQLGRAHLETGAVERARAWLERGLAFSHEIGFQTLVGHTLDNLARVLLRLGEVEEAVAACERALPLAVDSGDKWLQASMHAAHGMALKASGDLTGARAAFRESLEVARSFGGLGFAMESFVGLADPAYHPDRHDRSVALLSCVAASSLTPDFIAREAREQVAQLAGVVSPEALGAAAELGRTMDLEEALAMAFEAQVPTPGPPRRASRVDRSVQPN